jgi:hypothetical protein
VNAKQTRIEGGLIRTSNPVDSNAITLEPLAEDTIIADVATTVLDNGLRTRRQGVFQNQNLGPPYTYGLYEDVLAGGAATGGRASLDLRRIEHHAWCSNDV